MTKEQLFESMQYIGDDLISASERPARTRRPWLGVAAAAACFVLIAGVWLSRPRPDAGEGNNEVDFQGIGTPHRPDAGAGNVAELKGDQTPPPDVVPAGVPGGMTIDVPGSSNGPAATPGAAPTVLAWNELKTMPEHEAMFFAVFGQPLTEEQLAACCPEIRLEWMESMRGYAELFGWGELYRVTITATDPAWDGNLTVYLRDRDALQAPAQPWDEEWRKEVETRIAALNGQEYRAYRFEYDYLPGEPHVWMCVVFEKENVEYTLLADAPAAQETEAAVDLMDLLLAYAGTHNVPELSGFRCGDGAPVE